VTRVGPDVRITARPTAWQQEEATRTSEESSEEGTEKG
jgi:hypothetical protein